MGSKSCLVATALPAVCHSPICCPTAHSSPCPCIRASSLPKIIREKLPEPGQLVLCADGEPLKIGLAERASLYFTNLMLPCPPGAPSPPATDCGSGPTTRARLFPFAANPLLRVPRKLKAAAQKRRAGDDVTENLINDYLAPGASIVLPGALGQPACHRQGLRRRTDGVGSLSVRGENRPTKTPFAAARKRRRHRQFYQPRE